jgi:hypothetical protein
MGEHRNLTLAIDGELLDRVRVVAAERRTSVTRLVRDYLRALVDEDERYGRAAARLRARMEAPVLAVGGSRWTREELYDRG